MLSNLIDWSVIWAALIGGGVLVVELGLVGGEGAPTDLGNFLWMLLGVAAISVFGWNSIVRDGRTGRSVGRLVAGTRLLSATTGEPIGPGMAFARQLCHIADSFCYVGYLWPLFDPQRQTFADKMAGRWWSARVSDRQRRPGSRPSPSCAAS